MRHFILFFSCVLFLTACKEEPKAITFETESLSKDFDISINVSYDKAEGDSEIVKTLNNSIENEIIKGVPYYEEYKNLDDALKGFNDRYLKFKSSYDDESQPWKLNIETELSYHSEEIITLSVNSYSDTGGAHGSDIIQLLNFNPKTGKLYELTDIINDVPAFSKIAKSYFIKNLETEKRDISEYFFGEDFTLPQNIGFSEDGLVLLYNVYEIAAYSEGYTEFVIPFEELEAYLKVN